MQINDAIEIIPKLFLYFIPGYIALNVKKHFKSEREPKESHILIMSIVVSFILSSIVDIAIYMIRLNMDKNLVISENVKNLILIITAIVVGCLWVLYYDSPFEKRINKILNCNINSQTSVWNKAMKSPKGAWARVYLYDHNLLYEGYLEYYTINPEDENREILLASYTSYKIDTKEIIEAYDDDSKMVLIKCNDLVNIEILKD